MRTIPYNTVPGATRKGPTYNDPTCNLCNMLQRVLFMLPWLLKAMTPTLDLTTSDDASEVVVLRALAAAGRNAFPMLVAASTAMAVSALLKVKVPYELVIVDDTLGSRMEYISLLHRWTVGADRPAIVRDLFERVPEHHAALGPWVEGSAPPYLTATKLAKV